MRQIEEHTVTKTGADRRIYDYCTGLFDQLPSRKGVKKAIKRGQILLNGEKVADGRWVSSGDVITLVDPENKGPKPYHLSLDVIFEDEAIALVAKPAGLLSSGNQFKTFAAALRHNLTPSHEKDALPWPLPTHRLDKATPGIMLIAKTASARIQIGQQFENKEISKVYHALVMGRIPTSGNIHAPIEGKTAQTSFRLVKEVPCLKSDYLSLVELKPTTGRTHQLRKHMAEMGTAILGDPLYSPEGLKLKNKGLFLVSNSIGFIHPKSKKRKTYGIAIPDKFYKRLHAEERRWKNIHLT
ncbi:MAG: RluA family pseudouridine synthase [Crocinitomicaceae bacterium]